MTVRTRVFDWRLASGHDARVLRIDPDRFGVLPLFNTSATPAEDRLAKVLGEARLDMGLTPVPPAAVRLKVPEVVRMDEVGEVTCLAERARPVPPGSARAAPLHLLRLAAARLAPGELLVNGSHFLFLLPELSGPWNAYGDPIGLSVASGVVETPPQAPRACLILTRDGPQIRRFGFGEGSVLLPDGRRARCHPFGPSAEHGPLTAFALFHGSRDGATPERPGAWDVAFVGRHSVAMKEGGGMPIPRAGCVVRLSSRQEAEAAVRVTHEPGPGIIEGVQAGPVIVEGGAPTEVNPRLFDEELMQADPRRPDAVPVSPHAWAADWHETRAARLSAGISTGGALFFCAVEGTSSFVRDKSRATGATLHDLACLMAEQGARTAMHLDGGGSTQVFCEGGGALLTPRDVHHGMPQSPAQFDRPLPLALKLG